MNNKEFTELQLRASLCPGLEVEWEAPDTYTHWAHLHRAAKELREVVAHARAGVAAIDQDKDLTADARKRRKHELARQTMAVLEKFPSMEKARQSVAYIQARWQAKIDAVLIKPEAGDAAVATLHWEVRDKLAQLKDPQDRMAWIQKFGNDPLIPSALLHGPAGLTNLSEAETALLQTKVEALADPKITEAKSKVTRALAELERAFRAAPSMVAQCAGLNKAAAARPLPSKAELPKLVSETPAATPSGGNTPTPPKAASPNWTSKSNGAPATADKPNWT